MNKHWVLAFDLGGTFVDLLARASDGREHRLKHPRGRGAPAAAALQAVQQLLDSSGLQPAQVAQVVHGTTVVTNLLVEQTLPPAGWITTRGFGDLLRLGRQQREDLYAAVPLPAVPTTLFPAALSFELGGRIDPQGVEVEPLDMVALDLAIDAIAAIGCRSVGVGLLFAHLNPAHEEAVAARLQQRLPQVALSLSHRVDPQPREVERFLATALQACVQPPLDDYLGALAQGLAAMGLPAPQLMASDTTLLTTEAARAAPLRLALSGPAAALRAAATPGATIVAMDVGGTTTDLGLVEDGVPRFAPQLQIGRYSLRQRAADIVSLPIGGGSVVRLLAGGALRIGPQSMGADPGPAAYGRGGVLPTLTDALLLLGRLPPQLAGGLALDAQQAAAALQPLAQVLGCTPPVLAQAVVDSAAVAIAEGLKRHAFDRGFDAPRAVLLAAGGGGAQHAAEVAQHVGMTSVLVPPHAGLLAAEGLLQDWPAASTTAVDAWPDVAPRGQGPAALFGATQTAWVPAGWCWRIDGRGQLLLQHGARDG